MGYEVSKGTAAKLLRLINQGGRPGGVSPPATGTGRYDTHIKITGTIEDGMYPCVPTHYDPVAEEWVEYGEHRAVPSNDEPLIVDRRYRAVCYGEADGVLVFGADPGPPVACGLTYIESGSDTGKIGVDAAALAGTGLTTTDDDCPKLAVDTDAIITEIMARLCVVKDGGGKVTAIKYWDAACGEHELPACAGCPDCCVPPAAPDELTVTLHATGDLADLDGVTLTVTWDDDNVWDSGDEPVTIGGYGYTLTAALYCGCEGWGGYCWQLYLTGDAGSPCGSFVYTTGVGPAPVSESGGCDPWADVTGDPVVLVNFDGDPQGCFSGTLGATYSAGV